MIIRDGRKDQDRAVTRAEFLELGDSADEDGHERDVPAAGEAEHDGVGDGCCGGGRGKP